MCRSASVARVIAAAAIAAVASLAHADTALRYGFGTPATAVEISGWDIDVRPDGTGLPEGHGSVAEGQAIYDAKCASCHGTFGESNDYMAIAGGVGTLASDQPQRTLGSKLNHATTLFDYIRRAMPFNAPQSLTGDEVYALTAYVLNLNDIVPPDATLTAISPRRHERSSPPRRPRALPRISRSSRRAWPATPFPPRSSGRRSAT